MPSGPQVNVFAEADADAGADADVDAHISSEPDVDGGTLGDGFVTIEGAGEGAAWFSFEHAIRTPKGSA